MKRTVLVTGGAGYIGSHALIELLAGGYAPIVLDNFSTGRRSNLPAGVVCYEGDVGDGPLVGRILGQHAITAVLHFAGSIIVPESIENPIAYYRNNTVNSLTLIEQCVAHGVKHFVFSSTAAVYGVPDVDGPVGEDAALNPISPYGASKRMVEEMLTDVSVAHPGFHAVALRYFNVAGADPEGRCGQTGPASTHLIRCAVETVLGERDQLTVFGDDYATRDGTCERDFIHVADLAALHLKALGYLEGGGASTTVNCGYGRGATVREVVSALEDLIGRPIPVVQGPRRAGDPPSLIADVSRMRALFDWAPRHDRLDVILDTALNWRKSERRRSGLEVGEAL